MVENGNGLKGLMGKSISGSVGIIIGISILLTPIALVKAHEIFFTKDEADTMEKHFNDNVKNINTNIGEIRNDVRDMRQYIMGRK